jgi:hypothetical protein
MGYGLSTAAIAARISESSRTNCETLQALAFGRFLDQLHSVAGQADRGAGRGMAKSWLRGPQPVGC